MGLDTVELVMAIEEEFGLEIPDETAAAMFTVGDMHSFLVSELSARGVTVQGEIVYSKMRDIICRHTGLRPDEVVPTARFVQDLHLD